MGITHNFNQLDLYEQVILIKDRQIVARGEKEEVIKQYFDS